MRRLANLNWLGLLTMVGLLGLQGTVWQERLVISAFGIRGIGSIYYLAFALNETVFEQAAELWALVALVIVISIVAHGMTAAPATRRLNRYLARRRDVVVPRAADASDG
mgnify:CR=1 FL=1